MELTKLFEKPLPKIPEEIRKELEHPEITMTRFEEKNELLKDERLQQEAGYGFFEDGSALVSMVCPMKGITPEMINWWFWWHPQADERYQVWFPGEHFKIGYARKDKEYFMQKQMPVFQPNDQYPKERIGTMTSTLVIQFKRPEEMGFDRKRMEENQIPVIVCGSVGIKNFMMHTEMTHIFKQTEDGLFLISRFWLGKRIRSGFLRRKIITEELVRGMAEHCCVEYRRLAEILPILYQEYRKDSL